MPRPIRRYQRLGEFIDTPWLEILRRIIDWRENFRLATLQTGFHLNPAEQAQLIEDMTMCIDVLDQDEPGNGARSG